MQSIDFPDNREFFEVASGHVLPSELGGQFDVFAPLAASGRPNIYCKIYFVLMIMYFLLFFIPRRRRMDIDLVLSVRLFVCPSQTCWGYISKTITDLNMKLQGCVDLIVEKCTAQEP